MPGTVATCTGTPRCWGRGALPRVTGLEAALPGLQPALCPLTCLQGVQRGLAHGFIGIAGGDGDTAGHPGGLVTGVAPQGHHWVRSHEGRVRQALPLPSPLSWRPRFESDDAIQGPVAHGPKLWQSQSSAPGGDGLPGLDVGRTGVCRRREGFSVAVTPSGSSPGKCRPRGCAGGSVWARR